MEVIELWRLLQDAEANCVIEADRLTSMVRDVSKVLMDLGMHPIPEIPRDPRTADDVLEVVAIILECLMEAYDSGHTPWN
jgi:hypothetical protein